MSAGVGAFVHPFSPAGRADPHAGYRWLRANAPVYYDPTSRFWLLTRHVDCALALRDPRFSAALGQRQRARGEPLPASMLTTDAPEHDRLRAPASALLGPPAVRALRPALAAAVGELLTVLSGQSTVDAAAEVGEPLATAVLGALLEVPAADRGLFADLARAASVNLDPMAAPANGPRAMGLLTGYLGSLLDAGALAGLAGDPRLSRPEVLGILSLVVVGGWRPLAELAGNALHLLLREGEPVTRRLRTGPVELAALAVDEVLRLEAPIPFTSRVATAPVRLAGGEELPAGARVLALLAAANRDPEVFDRAEEFVLDRSPNPHLGLGGGAHYCLGAMLVRRAGAHLLYELVRRFPGLAEAGEPYWAPSILPRRLENHRIGLGEPA